MLKPQQQYLMAQIIYENKRPLIPKEFTLSNPLIDQLFKECWNQESEKRPSMKLIVRKLEDIQGKHKF